MKNMKKILTLALVVLSVVAVALPALAVNNLPVGSFASCNAWDVNMRDNPGTSGTTVIGRTNYAHELYIHKRERVGNTDWYYVQSMTMGDWGWVSGDYVQASPGIGIGYSNAFIGSTCSVNTRDVNMRKGPATNYDFTPNRYAQPSHSLYVLSKTNSFDGYCWYRVTNNTTGDTGFIRGDYITQ